MVREGNNIFKFDESILDSKYLRNISWSFIPYPTANFIIFVPTEEVIVYINFMIPFAAIFMIGNIANISNRD